MAQDQSTETSVTTQVYEIYIKAYAPGDLGCDHLARVDREIRIWWDSRIPTAGRAVHFARGSTPVMMSMGMPEVAVDGEVVESVPHTKLVQTYRFLFNDAIEGRRVHATDL